ncbi:hypothetical protein [Micromonospora sp. LHW51205]|nr:hypothetical protein [Micromonospora sp. LHW51205]
MSESAIPSITETLRAQRKEQADKAAGVETPLARRGARMIAEQRKAQR